MAHSNLLVSMLLRRAARGSFKYRKQNSTGNTGPSRKGGGKAMVDWTRNDESWPGLRFGTGVLYQGRVDRVRCHFSLVGEADDEERWGRHAATPSSAGASSTRLRDRLSREYC